MDCHVSAASDVCYEKGWPIPFIWQRDSDCCACQGRGRCADGFQMAAGATSGDCASFAAGGECQSQSTCCVPEPSGPSRSFRRSADPVASFAAAEAYCGDSGLARIDSAAENALAAEACGDAVCWLSFRDPSLGGHWRWPGDELPLYTNWNGEYKQPGLDDNGGEREPYSTLNTRGTLWQPGSRTDLSVCCCMAAARTPQTRP